MAASPSTDQQPASSARFRKAYIFFSVHEELFHRMAERLRRAGVESFSGFVWGKQQQRAIENRGIAYEPLVIFSRDLRPKLAGKPDLAWLERRERELGVSIQRMLASERHLLKGRSFDEIMRLAEVGLREIADAYDRIQPDFVFSEDISCFHSYAHFVLARERGIPFWCIGTGRLPYRVSVYRSGLQHWEHVERLYAEILERGLTTEEERVAQTYVDEFRAKPKRPTGMDTRDTRPRIDGADASRWRNVAARYFGDPGDPTATPPLRAIKQRVERIARVRIADVLDTFEQPVDGEKYVLYPIHFQPEASTLVQAPMYLDQVQLLQDMAKSLPIGMRLYVKEHVSNRGRRPLAFYNAIRAIPSVRLLSPDTNTWSLIQNASAIAVITGTMGWEGLLFDKPVITFGDIFYNLLPHVYRASTVPKDGWYELFQRAVTQHRPQHEALLALIAAMHQASYPGFFMNPTSFPEVLEEENLDNVTNALETEMGLVVQPGRTTR